MDEDQRHGALDQHEQFSRLLGRLFQPGRCRSLCQTISDPVFTRSSATG